VVLNWQDESKVATTAIWTKTKKLFKFWRIIFLLDIRAKNKDQRIKTRQKNKEKRTRLSNL
jgi:hypothetical protein